MNRVVFAIAGCLGAFGAHIGRAAALEVSRSRDIPIAPAAVWAIVGDFCAIQRWHPMVEGCVISQGSDDNAKSASIRSLVVSGGLGTIVEMETSRDETAMSYSYAFIRGPLPVKTYKSTIVVRPNGSTATVVWTATFDAAGMSDAEAIADIEGAYDQGLAGIAKEASR